MDIFMALAIFVIFIILFTLCGWCCKRKREGTVYGYGPSVTVTTHTTSQPSQSPLVVPPYPVDPRHPTPYSNAPNAGFNTHQTPYPTHATTMPLPQSGSHPYPPSGPTPYPPGGPSPYPPAGNAAPYPPAAGDYSANPPPYDVAVSTPPVQPLPVKEGYGKQAPYNPHYN
ncbi:uncharacterized protein isoform X2 [Leptinotarsa decemlineata]|uniref:uncharacterized protein isoform X2 n=1 Tax=Leptinotarsa decemlineata TaxID=7539 RepID=UPI000C253426|nr:leucine-rich repeat extensin-like protein 5 isoform X2 [Leptinotarsa decemlineata]